MSSLLSFESKIFLELIKVLFQKFKNGLKSDLTEKCPKCNELDCDCFPPEETTEPMLVLNTSDFKTNHIIPYDFNTNGANNTTISRNNTEITLNGNQTNIMLPR